MLYNPELIMKGHNGPLMKGQNGWIMKGHYRSIII